MREVADSDYLTVSSAAKYLQVSPSYLYRQIAEGESADKPLPAIRFGRVVRFRRADLDKWADGQKRQPVAKAV